MNLHTLTVTEAADQTGVPPETIRRLLKSGELQGPKVGRNYRVSMESLSAWVFRQSARPATASATRAFSDVEDHFA